MLSVGRTLDQICELCSERFEEMDGRKEGKVSQMLSNLYIFFQHGALKMTDLQADLPLAAFPSSAELVPEPLGVVLIISSWNFPFGTIFVLFLLLQERSVNQLSFD